MNKDLLTRAFPGSSIIETHLSLVVLSGNFAFKFKKNVKYPFVDQSSLDLRRALCQKEVELNRRFAPTVYIKVIRLCQRNGTEDFVVLDESDDQHQALEFAVMMNRFELEGQVALEKKILTRKIVSDFGASISSVHESIIPTTDGIGTEQKDQIDNVEYLELNSPPSENVQIIRSWIEKEGVRLKPLMEKRRREGKLKECHGDLHLTNTVILDGKLVAFDCLEFNLALRMIDVCCDIAFFIMDMDFRGESGLGAAFLSSYLESSGDFEAIGLLRYFLVYRTMVRAKIHCISGNMERMRQHIDLAVKYTQYQQPRCILMSGVSGSGKSFVSEILVFALSSIRIRSDIERKRLCGLKPLDVSGSMALGAGIYSEEMTGRVLQRIEEIVCVALQNGQSVIVDSTSLKRSWRCQIQNACSKFEAKFVLLQCKANEDVLFRRVQERKLIGKDASEASEQVLRNQLDKLEALSEPHLTIDTSTNLTEEEVIEFAQSNLK